MRRAAACVFVFPPGLRGAVPACRMTQQPWRFLEKHFRLLQVKIVLAAKLPLLAAFLSELQEKQFNVCGSAYPSKMQRCLRLLGCYYGWCLWRRNVLSIPQAWTSFSSWSQLAYPSHAGSPSFWLLLVMGLIAVVIFLSSRVREKWSECGERTINHYLCSDNLYFCG